MPYDPDQHSGRLRRLDRQFYQGRQWVHWIMTINQRQTGWLDERHHSEVRELLCHTMAREQLICPVYCLMPDHAHFLFGGLEGGSDQKSAVKFFRTQWNRILGNRSPSVKLQEQAFDHVLTEAERERGTVEGVARYILENPRRAGLVESFEEWPFLGSMVAGYPALDPRDDDYCPSLWKIYDRLINRE
ncbi:MAG TPA: hypothetical protein PK529_01550 [Verrucomicrobiales bacterium]|nr:hypothetical protein [Verrucomicrobiales bacterium]